MKEMGFDIGMRQDCRVEEGQPLLFTESIMWLCRHSNDTMCIQTVLDVCYYMVLDQ